MVKRSLACTTREGLRPTMLRSGTSAYFLFPSDRKPPRTYNRERTGASQGGPLQRKLS